MGQKRVKDMPREQQKAVFASIDDGGKTYRRDYDEPEKKIKFKKQQHTVYADVPKAGEYKPFTTKADRDRLIKERFAEKDAEDKEFKKAMKTEYGKTIHTSRTDDDAKRMKTPKYSSFDWTKDTKHGDIFVNEEHTVMRGTSKELLKEEVQASWVFDNTEKDFNLKVKDESIDLADEGVIKIGNGCYWKGYLYSISEEIIGEKILRKDGSRPIKKACGDTIILHTRQSEKDNQPLIIEGNDGYYAIAPRIEDY